MIIYHGRLSFSITVHVLGLMLQRCSCVYLGGGEPEFEETEQLVGSDDGDLRLRVHPSLQGGGQVQPEGGAAGDWTDRPVQR